MMIDDDDDSVSCTYFCDSRNCHSWIDHFVLFTHLLVDVSSAGIIETVCNLSDHNPIMIELDVSCILDNASACVFNTTCDNKATSGIARGAWVHVPPS